MDSGPGSDILVGLVVVSRPIDDELASLRKEVTSSNVANVPAREQLALLETLWVIEFLYLQDVVYRAPAQQGRNPATQI